MLIFSSGQTFEDLSLSKLNEIILLLRNLKIQSQSNLVANSTNRSFFESSKCPKLPMKKETELLRVNESLNKKSFKIKLVCKSFVFIISFY